MYGYFDIKTQLLLLLTLLFYEKSYINIYEI